MTDTNYDEMIKELRTACRNTDIIIYTKNCICVDREMFKRLNAIFIIDCSIENPVLYHNGAYWGNKTIENLLCKYKLGLEWLDDDNSYIYPSNDDYIISMLKQSPLWNKKIKGSPI